MARKNNKKLFNPTNPDKYKGQYPIVARSSWELQFMRWCDGNSNIETWSSESVKIPYFDPVRNKRRRYFPDFLLGVRDKEGNIVKYVVEIKPHKESVPPKPGIKTKKTRLYEVKTYKTNQAKWRAAKDYCKKMGYIFKVITEKELF